MKTPRNHLPMKSAEEWMRDVEFNNEGNWTADWVRAVQRDAFHAGKLSGLADAEQIVRRCGDQVKEITFDAAAKEIDSAYTELESKP